MPYRGLPVPYSTDLVPPPPVAHGRGSSQPATNMADLHAHLPAAVCYCLLLPAAPCCCPASQAVAARQPGKNVGQVVLRWALQLGQVVIPRSANLDHIPQNLQLFDFSLSDAEMQAINTLDGTWKTGGLPLPVA